MNLIVVQSPDDLYRRAAAYIAEYAQNHPGARIYLAPCEISGGVSRLLPGLSCTESGEQIDLALVDADFTQPETIQKAQRVLVAACGSAQADKIHNAFCTPALERHPLSALQEHAGLTVLIDCEIAVTF